MIRLSDDAIAMRCDAIKQDLQARLKEVSPMAIAIGRLLREAKEIIRHGNFAKWCEAELGLKPRTAQLWMLHATIADELGPDCAGLSLDALKATQEASPELQAEVLKEAALGNPPSSADVRQRDAAHRSASVEAVTCEQPATLLIAQLAKKILEHLPPALVEALREFLDQAQLRDLKELRQQLFDYARLA